MSYREPEHCTNEACRFRRPLLWFRWGTLFVIAGVPLILLAVSRL